MATWFGQSGLAGAWGASVARFNVAYFGYLAYVDVFYLALLSVLARRASLRALEWLLSSLLCFLALLLAQALLWRKGIVGCALLEVLEVYIGVVGVWLVALILMGYAFFSLSPQMSKRIVLYMRVTLLELPCYYARLRTWTQNKFDQTYKAPRFKPHMSKASPPSQSSPFKVKITPYTQAPTPPSQALDPQVQLIPSKPSTSNSKSAYLDLVQQRRSLQTPEINSSPPSPRPTLSTLPSTDLLNPSMPVSHALDQIEQQAKNLLAKLRTFKIEGEIVHTCIGPVVCTFEFRPAPHVKVSKIMGLADDLAMALCAQSMRIHAPIQGKDVMGIEIARNQSEIIALKEVLESPLFQQASYPLALALGKDVRGEVFVRDLSTLPHLLIAGTTGSGKSVGLHAMLLSLLYKNTPDMVRLLVIDPKRVEFSAYADIPHLITPIITDPNQAINALKSAVQEMERRYTCMSALRVKNLQSYNAKTSEHLPFLVIVIDELADLMMVGGKEVEAPIIRIAQMGRASGIHLIVATQRPSVEVLTGLIKTNLPCRISFKVGSKIDSRIILDSDGAQNLLGRGDMLFAQNNMLQRLHAPYATEAEIERVMDFLRAQQVAHYDPNFTLEDHD
ncbi:DNA translocase FtsK [Helicobacter baculiformis]|uniref:DNA translocase FtsK n=1 Tax=Helicobacter baculiformis TaxID=427351 RepID=A0ABV7ZMG1_9HELI|nr:DNA translocase FtsK [Helicobacter baculiformis]